MVVNLAVYYLQNPQTTQSVLQRGLTVRLDAVEKLLRRLAAGEPAGSKRSPLVRLAMEGVVKQISLLKMAGVVEPRLKKYQAEVRAQFIVIDRLVTAASVLAAKGVPSPSRQVP